MGFQKFTYKKLLFPDFLLEKRRALPSCHFVWEKIHFLKCPHITIFAGCAVYFNVFFIIFQFPLSQIDSHYYGTVVIAPLNIVLYNVFTSHGPNIYGKKVFYVSSDFIQSSKTSVSVYYDNVHTLIYDLLRTQIEFVMNLLF